MHDPFSNEALRSKVDVTEQIYRTISSHRKFDNLNGQKDTKIPRNRTKNYHMKLNLASIVIYLQENTNMQQEYSVHSYIYSLVDRQCFVFVASM